MRALCTALLALAVPVFVASCQPRSRAIGASDSRTSGAAPFVSPQERFAEAQREWQGPELSAGYAAWASLDRSSRQGQEAAERLAQAAQHYQQALHLIENGQPGARQELVRGKAVAPMDPALFLPLARACRQKDNTFQAVQYYRGYLNGAPIEPDATAARQELSELVIELGEVSIGPSPAPPASGLARVPPAALLFIGTALGVLLAAALAGVLGFEQRRRRGRSLGRLAEAYPELQPALAYLIGRLRHELLKHRIGAAADVAQALAAGQSTAELRVFLHKKLYGGERLDEAWRGYLHSFRRALGPEFDLSRSDGAFAAAQRAIRQLQTLELPLLRGERAAVRKLVTAHAELQKFDRGLAALVSRLQRTPLDAELIHQAVKAVRSEHLAGQVVLDVVEVSGPSEEVFVAVYRTDLLLILKNLLRNAILAASRAPPPRQIAVDVLLELLPTGEEMVRLRVHDSSPETLTPEQIYRSGDADPGGEQHGLGLVTAALGLYSGSIAVGPGLPGYQKCVAVQLFRTLDYDRDARDS
jgi:signal transduction histidine kinase